MTDMQNGGAEASSESKSMSLEESMAATFDAIEAREKASAPAGPSPEGAGLPSAEVESEQPVPSSQPDRLRGPDGKFIPKTTAEAAPVEAAPVQNSGDKSAETPVTQPASTPVVAAPVSWSSAAKAEWSKLPVAVQEAISKRESEASTGIKQYADKLKAFEPLNAAIGPRAQMLQAQYGSVTNGIDSVLKVAEFAGNNPVEFLRWFAGQRGISLDTLGNQPQAQSAPVDPVLAATQQRLGQLETFLQSQLRERQERETAELTGQIEAFKSDPAHEHFEAVRQDMAAMLNSGRAADLKTAYDMAVWANPETRAKVIESQRATEEAQRKAEAEKRATEARRIASTNVATKGTVGASPSKPKSMEETIRQTADRIYSAA